MVSASDEYWLNYLRSDKAELRKELAQRVKIKQNAQKFIHITKSEREEVCRALLMCNDATRSWLSPFINIPNTHQLLYAVLETEKKQHINEEEALKAFKYRLEEDILLKERLNEALELVENQGSKIREEFESACSLSKHSISIDSVNDTIQKRKTRTWKDIPEDELTERLAKGEMIPRDDWIPGVSKGGRKLNEKELTVHLSFGERLKKEGNEAYQSKNYDLALTRYSQGVNLLNWVEGENDVETQKIQDLLLTFLKNQAAAALYLNEFRIALTAAEHALKIDCYDEKSLYRHAQAAIALGEIQLAKKDLIFLLKSNYTTTEGHIAARQGIQQLRRILTKWKTTTKEFISTATNQETFCINRPKEDIKATTPNSCNDEPLILKDVENTCLFDDANHSKSKEKLSVQYNSSLLNEEQTQDTLEDILEVYSSKDVQNLLFNLQREADFDEKRVLIRAKKHLPSLLSPVFNEHQIEGDFFEQKKILDSSVQYWRLSNEKIKMLSETIYKIFLGDITLDE